MTKLNKLPYINKVTKEPSKKKYALPIGNEYDFFTKGIIKGLVDDKGKPVMQ